MVMSKRTQEPLDFTGYNEAIECITDSSHGYAASTIKLAPEITDPQYGDPTLYSTPANRSHKFNAGDTEWTSVPDASLLGMPLVAP